LPDDSVNVEMGIGHVVSTSHGYCNELKALTRAEPAALVLKSNCKSRPGS
jgi:hypothetical protein